MKRIEVYVEQLVQSIDKIIKHNNAWGDIAYIVQYNFAILKHSNSFNNIYVYNSYKVLVCYCKLILNVLIISNHSGRYRKKSIFKNNYFKEQAIAFIGKPVNLLTRI